MWRSCGKGIAAKMYKSKVGPGHRDRQRENWATDDLKGRHVQQCSKTRVRNNHKTGENRVHSHNNGEHSHNKLHSHVRVHSNNNREH
jgi:hypothetical protein